MLRRMFLILTLALLFSLGQQGAAMHAVSHYADLQEQQHDKAPHGTAACEKCVVYAGLSGAAPSAAFIVQALSGEHIRGEQPSLVARSLSVLPYSARAPPVLS
jgi:hypothetical protein